MCGEGEEMISIPKSIIREYDGIRGFKSKKRQQLKNLRRALDEFRSGCYWIPTGPYNVDIIYSCVNKLRQEMSTKNWGR